MCKYVDPSSLAECMLSPILGQKPPPWVIVLVDQTTVNGVQVMNGAITFQGRAVPVTWVDFEYPWQTLDPPSQNTIEGYLLTWLAEAAPPPARLMLVFDRGYARVGLIKDLNRSRQAFLIRAPGKVIVQAQVRGRRQHLSLGRLPHRTGQPCGYATSFTTAKKPSPWISLFTASGGSATLVSAAPSRFGALAADRRGRPALSPTQAD
jgi:hypothetical protein